jgi:hypothetical protein
MTELAAIASPRLYIVVNKYAFKPGAIAAISTIERMTSSVSSNHQQTNSEIIGCTIRVKVAMTEASQLVFFTEYRVSTPPKPKRATGMAERANNSIDA